MRLLFIFFFALLLAATTGSAQKSTSRPLSPSAQASIWEQELRDADIDFAKQTAARHMEGWIISLPMTLPSFTMVRPSPARMHYARFTNPCLPTRISPLHGRLAMLKLPRMARSVIPLASTKPERAQQFRVECIPPSGER
jgi:hypothetical protein